MVPFLTCKELASRRENIMIRELEDSSDDLDLENYD